MVCKKDYDMHRTTTRLQFQSCFLLKLFLELYINNHKWLIWLNYQLKFFLSLCVCVNTMVCKKDYYMHRTTTRQLFENMF